MKECENDLKYSELASSELLKDFEYKLSQSKN